MAYALPASLIRTELTIILAGEYPETMTQALGHLHISGDFTPFDTGLGPIAEGDATDLYHLILGEGQNAFVANGKLATKCVCLYLRLQVLVVRVLSTQMSSRRRTRRRCL